MEHIVQNAIKAERLVEARKALRRRDNIRVEALPQHKLIKKGAYVSQIFGTKERVGEGSNFSIQPSVNCQLCNRRGHLAGECRDRPSQINMAQLVCQICNRQGHSANQCRSGVKCQICQKLGHGARQCRFQVTGTSTCQMCNKPGHNASRCFQANPTADKQNSQLEARAHLKWQLCERSGHTAATCRIRTDKSCEYCRTRGHTIEDCRKRQYNERMKLGNGQSLPNTSTGVETPNYQVRSTNFIQAEDPICELLP